MTIGFGVFHVPLLPIHSNSDNSKSLHHLYPYEFKTEFPSHEVCISSINSMEPVYDDEECNWSLD